MISKEFFNKENIKMPPELPENFFRQLLIIYEFIFYWLDRPFLPVKMWPEFLKILKVALEKSLSQNEIPKEWLEKLWPGDHEYYREQKNKYESSRAPLSLTAKTEIRTVFQKLNEIETDADKISKKSEKHKFIKNELSKICRRAFNKCWEIAGMLGFENI